jgi:hypothetical protein
VPLEWLVPLALLVPLVPSQAPSAQVPPPIRLPVALCSRRASSGRQAPASGARCRPGGVAS